MACLVGPVPFEDVTEDGKMVISPPVEYADIVSTLPSITAHAGMLLRRYQGVWLLDHMVAGLISAQWRFVPRPGDVLLASPPKCGTTWIKALSFSIMARAVYQPSDAGHPLRRLNVPFMDNLFSAGQEARLEALPEHKDMLVSMWYFMQSNGGSNFPFSELFELACQGQDVYGPFWNHVLGYWTASRARLDRVLFLRYEEMLAEPASTIRQLARFLGVPFMAAEEATGTPVATAKMCSIDTMRGLDVNNTGSTGVFFKCPHKSFFRKGVVGYWANHMTPEMARRIDVIVEDKLRGSGLTFTSAPPTLT